MAQSALTTIASEFCEDQIDSESTALLMAGQEHTKMNDETGQEERTPERGEGAAAGLFAGTAEYYSRFRPPYPGELIAGIIAATGGNDGRLLDLGCGTGELALPLSASFNHVTAVDMEPEMIRIAARKAAMSGAGNISWVVGRAEDVPMPRAAWDYVTAGSSFHWMDRELLARRIFGVLPPGRAFFIVGGGSNPWWGTQRWQQAVVEMIARYFGERRASSGPLNIDKLCHDFLVPVGFDIDVREFNVALTWTIDRLIGFLYSTSFASHAVLGANRADFESGLRESLTRLDPSCRFREEVSYYLIQARKPI
jgi:SAM-dependent methyltransferase